MTTTATVAAAAAVVGALIATGVPALARPHHLRAPERLAPAPA